MNADLLREAAEWRLLSLLLECPNDIWRAQVCDLAKAVEDPLLRTAAGKALEEANEGLYNSLFGPGGPAAPREVSYSDSVQFGYLVSEIETFYDAFAYRPATHEAADHISVEAGFVSFLLMKQAFAEASGEAESASVTSDARQEFLKQHLVWIAEPLGERMEISGVGYLAFAGRWLGDRVRPYRQGPLPSAMLPVISDEREFCCGGAKAEVENC